MTTMSSESYRVLVQTPDYNLVVGEYEGDLQYLVVNRDTAVQELRGRHLPAALLAIHAMQHELDQVKANPKAAFELKRQEAERNPFAALGLAADDDSPIN